MNDFKSRKMETSKFDIADYLRRNEMMAECLNLNTVLENEQLSVMLQSQLK